MSIVVEYYTAVVHVVFTDVIAGSEDTVRAAIHLSLTENKNQLR